ncbi:MAG: hypothetical protein WC538_18665 [Thermoanaerobaculia bacterium]
MPGHSTRTNDWTRLILLLALVTLSASADGGAPLLLVINLYVFSLGQVWIITSEFLYLRGKLLETSRAKLLGWVTVTNLVSTAVGALIIPFIWAVLFLVLSGLGSPNLPTLAGVLAAIGTWIIGDRSPYVWLAFSASAVLFVLTYFVTVWLEHRTLVFLLNRAGLPCPAELRKTVAVMNLISYAGLILLFAWGTTLGRRFFW